MRADQVAPEQWLRDVFIAGVGQTPITKDPQTRGRYLGAAAIKAALADAGIEAERIGALYVGNMLSGILAQQQQLGGLIADYTGLAGIEAVTIEAACASGAPRSASPTRPSRAAFTMPSPSAASSA